MRTAFVMLAAAITYGSGIAACTYLTIHGHPVVGVVTQLLSLCVSFNSSPKAEAG